MFWIVLASWAALMDQVDPNRQVYLFADDATARLIYSPCWKEETEECIEYELSCSKDDYRLKFHVFEDAMSLGRKLIGTEGGRRIEGLLYLSDAQTKVTLDLSEITFGYSAMTTAWDLSLTIENSSVAFDALTSRSHLGAAIVLDDRYFPLRLHHNQGPGLMEFKEACIAINEHLRP